MVVRVRLPGQVIAMTWKSVLAACPASCSALMDGYKGTVHALYQCSIHCKSTCVAEIGANKRKWAPQTTRDTRKAVQQRVQTKLNRKINTEFSSCTSSTRQSMTGLRCFGLIPEKLRPIFNSRRKWFCWNKFRHLDYFTWFSKLSTASSNHWQ